MSMTSKNCDFSISLGDGLFRCAVCSSLGGKADIQQCRTSSSQPLKAPSKPLSKPVSQGIKEALQRAKERVKGDCGCQKKKPPKATS